MSRAALRPLDSPTRRTTLVDDVTLYGLNAEFGSFIGKHHLVYGLDLSRDVSWEEAVRSWYETLFQPMTGTIRASGVLAEFPGRTEADLYLFTARHLHDLRNRFGDDVAPGRAVRHVRLQARAQHSGRPRKRKADGTSRGEGDGGPGGAGG